WEYPEGARVLKVDSQGKLTLAGKNWKISNALAGEWVQVMQLKQRLQVYYCTTLIREKVCPEFCVNDRVLFLGMGCRGRGRFPCPGPSL
ncbi:MAG TPA: hypothetical protein VK198_03415, partial [Terriglobales bacterium]|nr:hypothetical protein [Terriglobales bacterium]